LLAIYFSFGIPKLTKFYEPRRKSNEKLFDELDNSFGVNDIIIYYDEPWGGRIPVWIRYFLESSKIRNSWTVYRAKNINILRNKILCPKGKIWWIFSSKSDAATGFNSLSINRQIDVQTFEKDILVNTREEIYSGTKIVDWTAILYRVFGSTSRGKSDRRKIYQKIADELENNIRIEKDEKLNFGKISNTEESFCCNDDFYDRTLLSETKKSSKYFLTDLTAIRGYNIKGYLFEWKKKKGKALIWDDKILTKSLVVSPKNNEKTIIKCILKKKFDRFITTVSSANKGGEVVFEVILDNQLLYKKKIDHNGNSKEIIDVNISGGEILELGTLSIRGDSQESGIWWNPILMTYN
jgi:hypothetical protein